MNMEEKFAGNHKPCISHALGGLCPVVKLAVDTFGESEGMRILLEETCFPMDDDVAMEQLQAIIARPIKGDSV